MLEILPEAKAQNAEEALSEGDDRAPCSDSAMPRDVGTTVEATVLSLAVKKSLGSIARTISRTVVMVDGVGGPDRLGEVIVEIVVIVRSVRLPGATGTQAKIATMMAAAGRTTTAVAWLGAVVVVREKVERGGGRGKNTGKRVKIEIQLRRETVSERNVNTDPTVARPPLRTTTMRAHPLRSIGVAAMRGIANLTDRVGHRLTSSDTKAGVVVGMKEAVVTGVKRGSETIVANTADLNTVNATGGTVTMTMVMNPRTIVRLASLTTARRGRHRPRAYLRQPLLWRLCQRLPSP